MPPSLPPTAPRPAAPPRPSTPTPTPAAAAAAAAAAPKRLIARPLRLRGVDLQHAEAVTHRLLHHAALAPVYHLPRLPTTLPEPVRAFLDAPACGTSPDESPPFDTLPPAIDPGWRPARAAEPSSTVHAPIPPGRSGRKRAQLRFLVTLLAPFLVDRRGARVHDLCAGTGHVGLVLAALFPDARVTLVDDGETPLRLAAARAQQAGLDNVDTECGAVQAAAPACDVVVALHACGGASEAALARAVTAGAALLVVVPCCVGGVVAQRGKVTGVTGGNGPVDLALAEATAAATAGNNGKGGKKKAPAERVWTKPRSGAFRKVLRQDAEFQSLLRAADYGEAGEAGAWRRVAKSCVEWDRLLWLHAAGYDSRLVKLRPESASPKNDVLVAWRRDGAAASVMQGEWCRDELANGTVADVRDRAAACTLGDAAQAAEIQTLLAHAVCADDAPGLYTSPPGLGRQRRKAVHAVADMLGLAHESVGKGADRVVVVRRSALWPLYHDEYVGIAGPHVAALAERLCKCVPAALVKRREQLRGSGVHITLVGPEEVTKLPDQFKRDLKACAADAYERLKSSAFDVFGVGRVAERLKPQQKDGPEVDNEAYFGVVLWPEVQAWRATLGLGHKDLHVTLGFTVKDVHRARARKDASSVVIAARESCSPWVT